MPFSEFMNDTVSLVKKDGTKINGLKASVQRNKIFMNAGKLLIEPEDLIQRIMSNGGEEMYRVIDPGFYEAFHGIPANYQMTVHKLGIPEAKQAIHSVTYNITGNNARINQSSIDNSTNIIQIDTATQKYFDELREEIANNISIEDRPNALDIVDTIEEQLKSASPKKAVVSALLNSLPAVGNIATIVSTIVSLL
jgi:hypothetical protein